MIPEKYKVEITNEDGSIDVYETDGINPPTKNGVPLTEYSEFNLDKHTGLPPKLPTIIRWSEPIKKSLCL